MHTRHAETLTAPLPRTDRPALFQDLLQRVGALMPEQARADARALWLPIGTSILIIIALFSGIVAATVWVVRTGDKAEVTTTLASELKIMNTQIATLQGSVNALMQMQGTVAETKAAVGSMGSRLDAMDIAIQTQNQWIITTRERLSRQGFETSEFKPPPTTGGP